MVQNNAEVAVPPETMHARSVEFGSMSVSTLMLACVACWFAVRIVTESEMRQVEGMSGRRPARNLPSKGKIEGKRGKQKFGGDGGDDGHQEPFPSPSPLPQRRGTVAMGASSMYGS